jgi:hypothetical protein
MKLKKLTVQIPRFSRMLLAARTIAISVDGFKIANSRRHRVLRRERLSTTR